RVPRGFPLEAARWPRLRADARRLCGRPHHLSVHPGGIVITPKPIENYVPLQRAPKGVIITQMEKDAVEAIGLVKIDLLGNRGLATLGEARRLVAQASRRSPSVPLEACPLQPQAGRLGYEEAWATQDDRQTVELVQRGDTLGVNQLESPAMRH